jgi:peptidase E
MDMVCKYLDRNEQRSQWCNVLLTSAGFYSNGLPHTEIIEKFTAMLGKPMTDARVLFIPTAIKYPGNDPGEYIDICMNELLMLGILAEKITTYDIDGSLSLQDAMEFDVIYFIGGDTAYLANRVKETKFDDIIKQMVYANKVYIGISAGSLLAMSNFFAPFNIEPTTGEFTGLGLVDVFFTVHCEPETPPRVDLPRTHIALTDKQAIIAKWNGYEVI